MGTLRKSSILAEMSSKEIAIRMQKQGNEYVVTLPGKDPVFTKTVKEAGDKAKGVKDARVMKINDYMRGGKQHESRGALSEGMGRLTLVPAYGRDYKSKKEVEAAWKEGKDFMIMDMSSPDDGRYINLQDAQSDKGLKQVNIRYKKMTQITVIDVK